MDGKNGVIRDLYSRPDKPQYPYSVNSQVETKVSTGCTQRPRLILVNFEVSRLFRGEYDFD